MRALASVAMMAAGAAAAPVLFPMHVLPYNDPDWPSVVWEVQLQASPMPSCSATCALYGASCSNARLAAGLNYTQMRSLVVGTRFACGALVPETDAFLPNNNGQNTCFYPAAGASAATCDSVTKDSPRFCPCVQPSPPPGPPLPPGPPPPRKAALPPPPVIGIPLKLPPQPPLKPSPAPPPKSAVSG